MSQQNGTVCFVGNMDRLEAVRLLEEGVFHRERDIAPVTLPQKAARHVCSGGNTDEDIYFAIDVVDDLGV